MWFLQKLLLLWTVKRNYVRGTWIPKQRWNVSVPLKTTDLKNGYERLTLCKCYRLNARASFLLHTCLKAALSRLCCICPVDAAPPAGGTVLWRQPLAHWDSGWGRWRWRADWPWRTSCRNEWCLDSAGSNSLRCSPPGRCPLLLQGPPCILKWGERTG